MPAPGPGTGRAACDRRRRRAQTGPRCRAPICCAGATAPPIRVDSRGFMLDRFGGGGLASSQGDGELFVASALLLRRHPRGERAAPTGAVARAARGRGRLPDADHRRVRHGQGAAGARDPQREPAERGPVRRDQLRDAVGRAGGHRALRPRAGRLHRGRSPPAHRPPRRRVGRHAVPRRAPGHGAGVTERAAPLPRDAELRTRRGHAARRGERPRRRHVEHRRGRGGAPWARALRPALPAELPHHRHPAAARAASGHPTDRREVPARGAAFPRRGGRRVLDRTGDLPASVAGERARTAQRAAEGDPRLHPRAARRGRPAALAVERDVGSPAPHESTNGQAAEDLAALRAVLRANRDNVSAAARGLGIHRSTVYRRLARGGTRGPRRS
jgi:regulatory Fis family protein